MMLCVCVERCCLLYVLCVFSFLSAVTGLGLLFVPPVNVLGCDVFGPYTVITYVSQEVCSSVEEGETLDFSFIGNTHCYLRLLPLFY